MVAEEVGVEPTRHFVSTSPVLKTGRPTGDIALPLFGGIILHLEIPCWKSSVDHATAVTFTPGEVNGIEILHQFYDQVTP